MEGPFLCILRGEIPCNKKVVSLQHRGYGGMHVDFKKFFEQLFWSHLYNKFLEIKYVYKVIELNIPLGILLKFLDFKKSF